MEISTKTKEIIYHGTIEESKDVNNKVEIIFVSNETKNSFCFQLDFRNIFFAETFLRISRKSWKFEI